MDEHRKWMTLKELKALLEEPLPCEPIIDLTFDLAFAEYAAQVMDSIIGSLGVPAAILCPEPSLTMLDLAGLAFERSLEALGRYHKLGVHRFSTGGVSRAMVRAGRWSAD